MDRLTLELGNLRAAMAWELDQCPEDALAIAGNRQYFSARDLGLSDGRDWVRNALELTGALPRAEFY